MIRKLIARLFNLVLIEDARVLQAENSNYRVQMDTLRARLVSLEESLGQERFERLKLQEIIFRNHGVIPNVEDPESRLGAPVRVSRERWSNLKSRMEADDRLRVERENKSPV